MSNEKLELKRKTVPKEVRKTIARVHDFLKRDSKIIHQILHDHELKERSVLISKLTEHVMKVRNRTAEAVGVSSSTVGRILSEAAHSNFKSPYQNRAESKKMLEINYHNTSVIRTTLQNYYSKYGELPILTKLKKIFQEKLNYKGSDTTLRRVLVNLGYKLKITKDNNKRVIIENRDVEMLRYNFLKQLMQYRNENQTLVYTDVTYMLTDRKKKYIANRQKVFILQAGTKKGFIPEVLKTFEADSVHSGIDAKIYEKWLLDQVVPSLPKNSVLILGNGPYPNTLADNLSTFSKINDLQRWLNERNIYFDPSLNRTGLYNLVKGNKNKFSTFKIDKILTSQNIPFLRIPPCHPELNPIEIIFDIIRIDVATHRIETVPEIMSVVEDCCDKISSEVWSNSFQDVNKIEEKYFNRLDTRLLEASLVDPDSPDLNSPESDSDTEGDSEDKHKIQNKMEIPIKIKIETEIKVEPIPTEDDDMNDYG